MNIEGIPLDALGQHLPTLARIVGFMLTAPPFSTKIAPKSAKIGLSIILWLCLIDLPNAHQNKQSDTDIYAITFAELLSGFMLGFLVQIIFSTFDTVGELLSNGMGLSFPGTFDPVAQETSGPVAGLTQMLAVSIFITAGGLETSVAYLIKSFDFLPSASLPSLISFKNHTITLLTECTKLAITTSISIWGGLLLANLLMLISARLAGGLNLMNSGLPLLLIIGLVIIGLLLPSTVIDLWDKIPPIGTLHTHK